MGITREVFWDMNVLPTVPHWHRSSFGNSSARWPVNICGNCQRRRLGFSHTVSGIRTWIPSAAELLGLAPPTRCTQRVLCHVDSDTNDDSQERSGVCFHRFCSPCFNHQGFDAITGSQENHLMIRTGVPSKCRQEKLALQQRLKAQAHEIASLRHLVDTLADAMQRCNSKNFALQMALEDRRQDAEFVAEKNPIWTGIHAEHESRRSPADGSVPWGNREIPHYENNWELTEDLERIRDLLLVALSKVKDLENQVKRIPELEQISAELLHQMAKKDTLNDMEGRAPSKESTEDMNPAESNQESNPNNDQKSDVPNDVTDCDINSSKCQLRQEMALLQKHWEEAEKDWEEERFILLEELERRRHEVEEQEAELNLLEEERNKFRQHETKVKDILKVLKNLKLLNLPHRTLGKLLIQSLSACRDQSRPENHVRNFLEQLYQNLLGCELLHTNSLLPLALQMGNGD